MYLIPPSKRSPFYQLAYIKSGRWTSKSTGEKTKSAALRFLTDFKIDLKELSLKQVTLKEFREEYLGDSLVLHSKSYQDSIRYAFLRMIDHLQSVDKSGENILLTDISERIAERFLLSVYKGSPSLAFQIRRTLKAAFNKALIWQYAELNPFLKIKLPRPVDKLPGFIVPDQFQKILDNTSEKYLRDIFITAYMTGMRREEILSLSWQSVDLNQSLIRVKNTESFTTKSRKERMIPVNRTLAGILKSRIPKVISLAGPEYVFTRVPGIKLNGNYISKAFKKSVRISGLTDEFHFHTLRHSFASLLVQKGVSLYFVKQLLGHSSISTTQIYSHLAADSLFDAVAVINDISKLKVKNG